MGSSSFSVTRNSICVDDESTDPSIAQSSSSNRIATSAIDDAPHNGKSSCTFNANGFPRYPPFAFASSTAICAPCSIAIPYGESSFSASSGPRNPRLIVFSTATSPSGSPRAAPSYSSVFGSTNHCWYGFRNPPYGAAAGGIFAYGIVALCADSGVATLCATAALTPATLSTTTAIPLRILIIELLCLRLPATRQTIHHLGHDGQPRQIARCAKQLQSLHAEPLKIMRRRARLERLTPQQIRGRSSRLVCPAIFRSILTSRLSIPQYPESQRSPSLPSRTAS